MVPPPPPPPVPPPPPTSTSTPSTVPFGGGDGGGKDRNALLKQIQKGGKLKKVETIDKSTPMISSKPSATANTIGGVGNSSSNNNNMKNVTQLGGGLFAGGIPKLRPSTNIPATNTNSNNNNTNNNNNNNNNSNSSLPRVVPMPSALKKSNENVFIPTRAQAPAVPSIPKPILNSSTPSSITPTSTTPTSITPTSITPSSNTPTSSNNRLPPPIPGRPRSSSNVAPSTHSNISNITRGIGPKVAPPPPPPTSSRPSISRSNDSISKSPAPERRPPPPPVPNRAPANPLPSSKQQQQVPVSNANLNPPPGVTTFINPPRKSPLVPRSSFGALSSAPSPSLLSNNIPSSLNGASVNNQQMEQEGRWMFRSIHDLPPPRMHASDHKIYSSGNTVGSAYSMDSVMTLAGITPPSGSISGDVNTITNNNYNTSSLGRNSVGPSRPAPPAPPRVPGRAPPPIPPR